MPITTGRCTRYFLATAAALLALGVNAQEADNEAGSGLPETMLWTSYPIGSAGHSEASAIANAFVNEYGTRVRIAPSSSAIGRLQPVISGRVDYGFLGSASFFSSEGIFDFADRDWGPQNLRALAGRASGFGLVTAADAGIRSVAEAEGKRVAYVAGNPSLNLLCDATLAFAGLTREDIQLIRFPSYGATMSSLAQGQADATCTTTTPSAMYELAESPRGIHWVDMPADNEEGWERVQAIAPFVQPFAETKGAGVSEENPAHIFAYRYPTLATQPDRSADEVYAFMKALDETFDQYKNATDLMMRWNLETSGTLPQNLPFHEGAIRYLKEIGVWTEEHQAWNEARLERLNTLRQAWDEVMAEGEDLSDEEFLDLWLERREQAIASLE